MTLKGLPLLLQCAITLIVLNSAVAIAEEPENAAEVTAEVAERRTDEAALNEDPEAQREVKREIEEATDDAAPVSKFSGEFYASARVHAINTFDEEKGETKQRIGDGNSRLGLRGDWQFSPGWYLYGRYEGGFDLVENFTTRADLFGDGGMTTRLAFIGIDSDKLKLGIGQNWSAYYQVAGITDRFAIFGGSASGVYNAGTAGQQTGTGRAEDVIQARTNVATTNWAPWLKPFKLNMQYQRGQPIPGVDNVNYDYSYGASAFLETQSEYGVGIAYNRAVVPGDAAASLNEVGIDGDSTAIAISTRTYGERWYVSVLYSRLNNMETTNEGIYFDGEGFEVFAQWQLRDKLWLIGGYNDLRPYDDETRAGEFRTRYGVVGARYTFRSFERMVYFEYRIDNGRLADGSPRDDEFTIGIRWDFET